MRIVIDLQGAQTNSRARGIGRYSMALAIAMARNKGDHEIVVALNALLADSIESIRAKFEGLLPRNAIRIWTAPRGITSLTSGTNSRKETAEVLRESFLASLRPDIVHVSSLFEGLEDEAATSLGRVQASYPTAVTLYDLIPYMDQSRYLCHQRMRRWYYEKLDHLKAAHLWLAVSASSRREGIEHLHIPDRHSVTISGDADPLFAKIPVSFAEENAMRARYKLSRPYVMYTAGIERRKNIEGLIRAYALLPTSIRNSYQLVIVCAANELDGRRLQRLACDHGLGQTDLVLTGFVPDQDLSILYNLCSLFVFPSFHEGLGLPALEAMRCGAPVIGANTTSLPEIIARPEAMFDPHSDQAIATLIEKALVDEVFRERLVGNSRERASCFSWDRSAKLAIAAMEKAVSDFRPKLKRRAASGRPKLAYVSPLPPATSGIADFSANLIPELSRHYEIEAIVQQEADSNEQESVDCRVRSAHWFQSHAAHYDRILYHFGNSGFHRHMFELLELHPGVVVLHDFYLSGVIRGMELQGHTPFFFTQELYDSHGYSPFLDNRWAHEPEDVVGRFPCNLRVLQNSLGFIVHSDYAAGLATEWYGSDQGRHAIALLPRNLAPPSSREEARKALSLNSEDFVVCSFGIVGPTKLSHRILKAWINSGLNKDESAHLVFVGKNRTDDYGKNLTATALSSHSSSNIRFPGRVDGKSYRHYLAAADVAVQLRSRNRGETSAAALDCMNQGIATIVNANGSLAELPPHAVCMLPDEFSEEQLIGALGSLRLNSRKRQLLGDNARLHVVDRHAPSKSAEMYKEAIEKFYANHVSGIGAIASHVRDMPTTREEGIVEIARAAARNFPPVPRQRQLLVDISELVSGNPKAGTQGVAHHVLREFFAHPPAELRVEPVYADGRRGYRYAREFTFSLFGAQPNSLADEAIDYFPDDIFLGLDFTPETHIRERALYRQMRMYGVGVFFLVYDLLPLLLPRFFPHTQVSTFAHWFNCVAEADGLIGASRPVAEQILAAQEHYGSQRERRLCIDWIGLSSGFDVSQSDAQTTLERLTERYERPSFLVVATIGLRICHEQILKAFELLWAMGRDYNLIFVGHKSLFTENTLKCMRTLRDRKHRLFWFEDLSQEELQGAYTRSRCLIAVSVNEQSGFPLVEALRCGCPVLARSMPFLHEMAGDNISYFSGSSGESLARDIEQIVNRAPCQERPLYETWEASAAKLSNILLTRQFSFSWIPSTKNIEQQIFPGSCVRFTNNGLTLHKQSMQ